MNKFQKNRVLNAATQAISLPKIMAPDVADAFLRTIWRDTMKEQVGFQPGQQNVLSKRSLDLHGRNYTPLLALHWGLTSLIAERLQMDLMPSFVWFRMYFGGDVCRVHSDRPACEVSLSLTLGYSDGEPWALDIGTQPVSNAQEITEDFGEESFSSFPMLAGDAVVYRGSNRRHGRVTPNPNRWSAHLFCQWVERGGPHAVEAFERLDFPRTD